MFRFRRISSVLEIGCKNDRRWEGPIKITAKDGKLLYGIKAGSSVTINVDHAKIAKSGEVLRRGYNFRKATAHRKVIILHQKWIT